MHPSISFISLLLHRSNAHSFILFFSFVLTPFCIKYAAISQRFRLAATCRTVFPNESVQLISRSQVRSIFPKKTYSKMNNRLQVPIYDEKNCKYMLFKHKKIFTSLCTSSSLLFITASKNIFCKLVSSCRFTPSMNWSIIYHEQSHLNLFGSPKF